MGATYTDSALLVGATYWYVVSAFDSALLGGTQPGPATTRDLAPPTGLTARVAGPQIVLEWDPAAAADLDGYHVYFTSPGGRRVRATAALLKSTRFFAQPAPGDGGLVQVPAIDTAGHESAAGSGVVAHVGLGTAGSTIRSPVSTLNRTLE
ncbi:MAG: hypothetical protein U0556_16450 [Dehalococcoidia bacterium]